MIKRKSNKKPIEDPVVKMNAWIDRAVKLSEECSFKYQYSKMIKAGNSDLTLDVVERVFKRLEGTVHKMTTLCNLIETVELYDPACIIVKGQMLEFLRLHIDALDKGNVLKKESILRTMENVELADKEEIRKNEESESDKSSSEEESDED